MNTASSSGTKRAQLPVGVVHAGVKSAPLRVGMVGGVERSEGLFQQAARTAGYELEVHSGHTAGRGAQTLAAMVNRVDLVVIVTDVNSHNAVVAARKLAASRGVRCLLIRRCSPSRLISLMQSQQAEPARVAPDLARPVRRSMT